MPEQKHAEPRSTLLVRQRGPQRLFEQIAKRVIVRLRGRPRGRRGGGVVKSANEGGYPSRQPKHPMIDPLAWPLMQTAQEQGRSAYSHAFGQRLNKLAGLGKQGKEDRGSRIPHTLERTRLFGDKYLVGRGNLLDCDDVRLLGGGSLRASLANERLAVSGVQPEKSRLVTREPSRAACERTSVTMARSSIPGSEQTATILKPIGPSGPNSNEQTRSLGAKRQLSPTDRAEEPSGSAAVKYSEPMKNSPSRSMNTYRARAKPTLSVLKFYFASFR